MEDSVFQTAYEATRQSLDDGQWISLTVRDRAALIYQEMRRIDAGNAMVTVQSPDARPRGGFGAGG